VAIEQQDVDVAVELAVLKAVVEDVNGGQLALGNIGWGFGLDKAASAKSLAGDIDGDAGFAGDEEGFVAEFLSGAVGVDTGGALATAAIAPGEDVYAEAAAFKSLREGDGEGGFACAPGGEIADADHRKAQAVDLLEAGAQAKFAEEQGEAVGGNQREKQLAG
jgi:hypothetical protein